MARTLEQERAAIETEARKLEERRRSLADREREQAIQPIDKGGLLKLETGQLARLVGRIMFLGIAEVEKRLTAYTAPAATLCRGTHRGGARKGVGLGKSGSGRL